MRWEKGQSRGFFIALIIGLILVFAIYFYFHKTCIIDDNLIEGAKTGSLNKLTLWTYENIFLCEKETTGILDASVSKIKQLFGFNETFYEFVYPHLVTGLLAGFWIWLMCSIAFFSEGISFFFEFLFLRVYHASARKYYNKFKLSWFAVLGDRWWKIIAIGVFYAVLMMIPIVNSIMDIITFKFLGVGILLRSFILAFYFALLPAGIEGYNMYRLRVKYYKKILEAKYRAQKVDQL